MAGKAGKSGGARLGAGRKSKNSHSESVSVKLEPQPHGGALKRSHAEAVPQGDKDMLTLLQDVALGKTDASALQVRAAIAAVQYTHAKVGEGGKKEQKEEAAKKVAGRFASAAPPKLVAAGGRKV